ncbi:uncharacterized protein LOC141843151 [Curcuma longa]|uniref:uncharacterized protein LOC141843151 n=1 Tax=Curcuma longa TaxID=136217 RepID=UPI003D9EAEEA
MKRKLCWLKSVRLLKWLLKRSLLLTLLFMISLEMRMRNLRLQEKLSSLESEAQVLRQQAVFSSPIKSMQEHLSTPITPTKQVFKALLTSISFIYFISFLFSNQYLETGQFDFEELKVANYMQVSQSAGPALRDIANSDAKLRSSMERKQEEENNNQLVYWLSNGSNLLYLLQHSLKVASAVGGLQTKNLLFLLHSLAG